MVSNTQPLQPSFAKASAGRVKVAIIVGARPNFMKAAPILKAMKQNGSFEPVLIHTGQHYDALMSDVFFKDLDMPAPDIFLGIGSGTHAEQTAKIMLAKEKYLIEMKPDLVLVVGDVNSTLAAALTAAKLNIPVAHVEAGLRSGDRTMPEEINRLLTDQISDLLFTTEPSGAENLKREGVAPEKIHFVGNTMIDSLIQNLPKIENSKILEKLNLQKGKYAALTLHRPSNVDTKEGLEKIFQALEPVLKKIASQNMSVVFPVHPRTRAKIAEFFPQLQLVGLIFTEPLGYSEFIKLVQLSRFTITDSGGIQEETSVLGVPCLTLRNSTERPITIEVGTNTLITDQELSRGKLQAEVDKILSGQYKQGKIPDLWDGKAAERIVAILSKIKPKSQSLKAIS